MKNWGTFLEYAGLETDEKGNKVFSDSYSGIDGGDINAEYWFMGMEWSDIGDIKDDYSYPYNAWRKITWKEIEKVSTDEKESLSDKIKKYPDDWKLENNLGALFRKLMPRIAERQGIFGNKSNTFKLNLLPLPFLDSDAKYDWDKTHLTEATGFSSFNEYKKGVLPARQKLFQELLKKGKRPKTIFCFGTTYHKEFLYTLTGKDDVLKEPTEKTEHTPIFVYNINSSEIKKIIICRFPLRYQFNKGDWEKIYKLAKE